MVENWGRDYSSGILTFPSPVGVPRPCLVFLPTSGKNIYDMEVN